MAVLGALASTAATLVISSPSASAAIIWSNEAAMVNDGTFGSRSTFVYDVGAGNKITQEQFAAPDVRSYYSAQGFDANFMVWAPFESIPLPNEKWSHCVGNPGGLCASPNFVNAGTPSGEIGSGPLEVKIWNGAWIARACGNWNHGGAGPIPVISGFKYEDLNADGQREAGEPGLSGWTMTLSDNGTPIASTTTGSDGSYSFSLDARSLPVGAGTYSVTETMQPGWLQSAAPAPIQLGLGAGQALFAEQNFGNFRPATVTGRKFEDLNADGSGAADPGLADWGISYSGRTSGSTTTSPDGTYALSGLTPGTYTIAEENRSGWTQSTPGGTGTYTVTVSSGQQLSGLDFGNWRAATITGRKFDDHGVDGSGEGDPGLSNWQITSNGTVSATTTTDGSYSIAGLKPGTYTIGELQQAGWRQTAPTSGDRTVTLTSGQTIDSVDFGNVCLGRIQVNVPGGSTVRVDEVSVPGILSNDPALPRLATGTSTIDGLLPGTYKVTVTLPDNVFTTDTGLTSIGGNFVVVKTVTVPECGAATVAPVIVLSAPGKITGGIRITMPNGYATGGFEFMQKSEGPRGTLEFNDHQTGGVRIHTDNITAISVTGNEAWVFGNAVIDGASRSFRLHLVDAGEPGTSDVFELMLSNGYSAGVGQLINDGNIQMH